MKLKKKHIIEEMSSKLLLRLNEKKIELSRLLFEEDPLGHKGEPEKTNVQKQPVNIIKITKGPNHYQFMFGYGSKIFVVEFLPIDKGAAKYDIEFYVKGQHDSTVPGVRYGITSPSMIEPVFVNIFRCIEQFLRIKKPVILRFVPGKDMQFPVIYHAHIYKVLKAIEPSVKNKYTIIRGDAIKDGSAFILRKGASSDILKQPSWRPTVAPEKEPQREPTKTIGPLDIVI